MDFLRLHTPAYKPRTSLGLDVESTCEALHRIYLRNGTIDEKKACVQGLLNLGFDINQEIVFDNKSQRLLDGVVRQRDYSFANYLVEDKGANPNLCDQESQQIWFMDDLEAIYSRTHTYSGWLTQTYEQFTEYFDSDVDDSCHEVVHHQRNDIETGLNDRSDFHVGQRVLDAHPSFSERINGGPNQHRLTVPTARLVSVLVPEQVNVVSDMTTTLAVVVNTPSPSSSNPHINQRATNRENTSLVSLPVPRNCAEQIMNKQLDCISTVSLGMTSSILGGVLLGSFEAGLNALVGYAGVTIIQRLGYGNFDTVEAIRMGMLGGGAIGTLLGGVAAPSLLLSRPGSVVRFFGATAITIGAVIPVTTAGGLLGYQIMNFAHSGTDMNFNQTIWSFGVGGAAAAVALIPVVCTAACFGAPIIWCLTACPQERQH